MLRHAGIEVTEFDMPAARQMIAGFVSRITRKRPRVVLKSASSLDGAVALESGESQWITGAAARRQVQRLRAQSDAVITGAGTVAADDPQLNVRDEELLAKPLKQPLRVVLDSSLRAPPNRQIFSDGTLGCTRARSRRALWAADTGYRRVPCLGWRPAQFDGFTRGLGRARLQQCAGGGRPKDPR